ncbi:MAG: TonB-dependent receptor [Myxococcota bacterium]
MSPHRSNPRRILPLALALALGAPPFAWAGPTDVGAMPAPSADAPTDPAPPVVQADAIAVEDQRLRPAEIYQDTPVETEILDAETLESLPGITLVDVLDAIPGLRITEQVQGQRGAVRIDGLLPEYTELLVDGQRYAGENDEANDAGDLLFADIERIEILRGPQSLRYSPRAMGGVINVLTPAPPTDGLFVRGRFGAGDQEQLTADATGAWGNASTGGRLTISHYQIGGFDPPDANSGDPDDGLGSPFGKGSTYRTTDVYGTFVARPSDALTLTTRAGYRLRDDALATGDGPVTARRERERWLLSQKARAQLTDATALLGTFTFSLETTESTVGRAFELVDDRERLELAVEHLLEWGPTTHVVTLGADLETNAIRVDERPVTLGTGDVYRPDDVDRRFHRAGFYGLVESDLTSWLATEVGLRRQIHEAFAPAWLPQAAILVTAWRWDEERALKLRLTAGRGVRYPSLRDVFQPPAPQVGATYFLAGSEDLLPEKVWAVRGGFEVDPTRWLSVSAMGFHSETKRFIRAQYDGLDIQVDERVIPADPLLCPVLPAFCVDQVSPVVAPVYENRNLDDLESWGVEARLELRPHERIELQLGYTWNRTRVVDSNVLFDELPNSPRHVANGRIRVELPVTDTVVTVRGQWRDRAILEGSGTGLVSFALDAESNTAFDLDLRLQQPLERWLGAKLVLFADVNNVTDNRVIDSYVVRGRSFFLGLRGEFD